MWRRKALPAAILSALTWTTVSLPAKATEGPDTSGFVENETQYRKDRGLSKMRTRAQFEISKDAGKLGIFSSVRFNGTFRASYDAVYDLNDDEYGKNAGGAITLQQVGGPLPPDLAAALPFDSIPPAQVPHGQGLVLEYIPGMLGAPWNGSYVPDLVNNPNAGLEVLGQDLHNVDGGMSFGVPVRPCNVDSRGCLKGYMDADLNELRSPEFNDELDFIREAYMDATIDFDSGSQLGIKLGKQQIIWGRTDLFRVLDVINPVDYSSNNIFDELEDIRIPLWMLEAEYRMGPTGVFDDLNFSAVWNFDKFRPHNLGQGGTPNQIIGAGGFFRGMNNCWKNGCTVSNFAFGHTTVEFQPHTIGIRDVNLPSNSLDDSQFGFKLEGVYKEIGFSLNYYNYRQQTPVLRSLIPANNPFTEGEDLAPRPFLPAFDIHFPEIEMIGGSADFYVDAIKSVFRVEAAVTFDEEFANTAREELYSKSDVFRWVVGWDRSTFIPFLNKRRAFLLSAQVFGQHLQDHELYEAPLGQIGIPDWEDNYTFTFLAKGWWMADQLSPQLLMAHDSKAKATAIELGVEWLLSNNWKIFGKYNVKIGDGAQKFNDTRNGNQFPPFTASPAHSDPMVAQTTGMSGYEPLGRFRSGPLGMAQAEDQVSINIRYSF